MIRKFRQQISMSWKLFDTDDPATAVFSHAGSGGARNWGDEVKETTELENELEELFRAVEREPWFTPSKFSISPNISLEDIERELHDLMSAGGQQQQQQHAEPVAMAETLTTNLGGGIQFLAELNPGTSPKPFKDQQPNPPLGVEVEVNETTTEDDCSNGGMQHSRRADEAEADANAPAETPFRRLLGQLTTLEQADEILKKAEGKYTAFERIIPFTAGEVQRLESVRPALLHLGLDIQTVQALLVPQLWKPKFLMLEVVRLLVTSPSAVGEAADIWDKWSGWVREPVSEDESHEGDYVDSDDIYESDLGDLDDQFGFFDFG
jgi:hypothetical protein